MSDYRRSTREVSLNMLRPALAEAILLHVGGQDRNDLLEAVRLCIETESERVKKPGLFSKLTGGDDYARWTGIVLAEGWLIWAMEFAKGGTVVKMARLNQIEARDYALSHLVEDNGITIAGTFFGVTDEHGVVRSGEMFIGLGPEPAADKARQTIKQAVEAAHQSN